MLTANSNTQPKTTNIYAEDGTMNPNIQSMSDLQINAKQRTWIDQELLTKGHHTYQTQMAQRDTKRRRTTNTVLLNSNYTVVKIGECIALYKERIPVENEKSSFSAEQQRYTRYNRLLRPRAILKSLAIAAKSSREREREDAALGTVLLGQTTAPTDGCADPARHS